MSVGSLPMLWSFLTIHWSMFTNLVINKLSQYIVKMPKGATNESAHMVYKKASVPEGPFSIHI